MEETSHPAVPVPIPDPWNHVHHKIVFYATYANVLKQFDV